MKPKKVKRFHRDIYFPDWYEESIKVYLKNLNKQGSFVFSIHAVVKIVSYCFKYGNITLKFLLKSIRKDSLKKDKIFEFYSLDENITKACFRFSYEDFPVDLIIVLSADATVITAFATNKGDNHHSLDKNLYQKG